MNYWESSPLNNVHNVPTTRWRRRKWRRRRIRGGGNPWLRWIIQVLWNHQHVVRVSRCWRIVGTTLPQTHHISKLFHGSYCSVCDDHSSVHDSQFLGRRASGLDLESENNKGALGRYFTQGVPFTKKAKRNQLVLYIIHCWSAFLHVPTGIAISMKYFERPKKDTREKETVYHIEASTRIIATAHSYILRIVTYR